MCCAKSHDFVSIINEHLDYKNSYLTLLYFVYWTEYEVRKIRRAEKDRKG